MISIRIRIKVLLLIVLGMSTIGLTGATAEEGCIAESCARVIENGQPVGYGCVAEGSVKRKCTATLSGCTFDSCGLID